jgi:formylglycine-generating enzyme required for sulfatase activity
MVGLPGGTFPMGERGDTVTVRPFCMDTTEVTVTAYAACDTASACADPGAFDGASKFSRACTWQRPGAGAHPVNCVDWRDASSYCAFVGKRLPSEEEWEWAARGGATAHSYPWGDERPTAERVNACGPECVQWKAANEGEAVTPLSPIADGWPITASVGSFPRGATREGLLDLAGNVWEWTANKVARGGGWSDSDPLVLRAADRSGRLWFGPTGSYTRVGFRCAR